VKGDGTDVKHTNYIFMNLIIARCLKKIKKIKIIKMPASTPKN
jgi:hypothetical protein